MKSATNATFVRAYLRASTEGQDATRARSSLESFAADRGLKIAACYVENESGASLNRPELFRLIADAHQGDVLLIEQVDRLSRLNAADWDVLKAALATKQIRVVALDLPTSWAMADAATDAFQASMFSAINGMMLDMLAAIARKDYQTRRDRCDQGIAKAAAGGKYKGRAENVERNDGIKAMLAAGTSWADVMKAVGCSRGTVAKAAATLKAA